MAIPMWLFAANLPLDHRKRLALRLVAEGLILGHPQK